MSLLIIWLYLIHVETISLSIIYLNHTNKSVGKLISLSNAIYSRCIFVRSETDQPICMYELDRNIVRMQYKYPESYMDRIVIVCEDGYNRIEDVKIQSRLALCDDILTSNPSPVSHAKAIYNTYLKLC